MIDERRYYRRCFQVLAEVNDLCQNGYFVRVEVFNKEFLHVGLKHYKNGHSISFHVNDEEAYMRKDGEVIKIFE